MKRIQTELVVIKKDNTWCRVEECCICLITVEEFQKLKNGTSPMDIDTISQMFIKNVTHKDVGALCF